MIKLATGNPGRRHLPQDEPAADGRPIKPPKLGERADALWDRVSALPWLTEADSYKLHVWCELQAEFEHAPSMMIASRIAQLRAVGSELGFDPGSRARLGKGASGGKQEETAAKYFGSG